MTSSSVSDDFPAPPVPVMPTTGDFFVPSLPCNSALSPARLPFSLAFARSTAEINRARGYLQKLRFDFIKIDGVFVQDILNHPVDQKMIRMIAEIGAEAGMQTIAEYVQNAESLALLGELGVDLAQGYFVGRPARQPQFRSTPIPFSRRRPRRKSLY